MTNLSPIRQNEAAARSDSDDEIDLFKLFGTLWRGKWVIVLSAIIAVVLGGYYAFFVATPLYRSTAVVLLEPRQQSIVNLEGIAGGLTGDSAELNSEVQVLQGRSLLGQVVDRLNLTQDPEFNSELRPPGRVRAIKSAIANAIGGNGAQAPQPSDPSHIRDQAISALLSRLSISNIRQSYVFNITAETESPTKSALIADTVARVYIENQLAVKLEQMESATRALSELVAEEQSALERAEAARSRFSSSTELISPEALAALERQLKDARDRLENARQEAARASETLQQLDLTVTREERAEQLNDPLLDRLISQKPVGWQADFDRQVDRLRLQAETTTTRQAQQIGLLEQSIAELDSQITQQNADLIRLQQLTREANATRATYEHLLTRLSETAVQQGVQQADSRVLSNAVVPSGPSAPRKSMIVVLSAILGVIAGAGVVLLLETRKRGFRLARDLEQFTGRTVLGQVPLLQARKRVRTLEYLQEKPTSAAAEAVRNLRTALLLSNVDNPPKVIAFTSSLSGEGKTTNALALAQNLSGMGKSVLIVEGDIRRRVFSEYFSSLPEKGLVSVLANENPIEAVVHREDRFGFDILIGERSEANAADLFSSQRFAALIRDLRERYDQVIIDTPPVLLVPDAMIIAQQTDALMFTVKWDSTSSEQVDEALRQIRNAGQDVTGLILGQVNPKGMKRYGYDKGYGSYGAYGSAYYHN